MFTVFWKRTTKVKGTQIIRSTDLGTPKARPTLMFTMNLKKLLVVKGHPC